MRGKQIMKVKMKLQGVPKTLLMPLRARYLETKKTNNIISDPKTVEILDQIEYNFSGKNEISVSSQLGIAIRTEILDEQTKNFLSKNSDAIIVNLGCGLDTRFHRLNNQLVTWYDLDMPEVIAIKKKFFDEDQIANYQFIAKSIFDFTWIETIPKNKPTLFIAEGLLMYFSEEEVKLILKTIGQAFPGAELLFEAISPFIAKRAHKHPDVKKFNVPFKWGIKTGQEIEKWHIDIQFIDEWYYFGRHKNKQPFSIRLMSLLPVFKKSAKIVRIKFISK